MLIVTAAVLVLLALADIVSSIFTTRFVERLRAELFDAIEEQRQTFRQLRQVRAELKLAEARRDAAQRRCDELQDKLARIQVRLHALADQAEKRRDVRVRGQHP
jgi:septal ring factor EnvC (AmiA/AmiB activator)